MGSVSERVWIKFESDEKPHESTSTLVLTSPSGRYVDTRILVKEPGYCNHPTMQQPTGYPPLVGGVKHLDWAFWGVATVTEVEWDDVRSVMQRMSLKVDDVGLEVPTKKGEEAVEAELEPGKEMVKQVQRAKGKARECVWSHLLDSRALIHNTNDPDDHGIIFPTDVEGEELERGIMINPANHRVEEYSELWREVEIKHPPWMHYRSVVWCCDVPDSDEGEISGVLIRLGQYAQGIWRKMDMLVVERWEADFEERRWKWVARIGNSHLPIYPLFYALLECENNCPYRGAEIDGIRWDIIEAHT